MTLRHNRNTQSLKLSFLRGIATAQAAFFDVDGLGLRVVFGPVPRDETLLAVVAMNLKRAITAGTVGEHEVGMRVLSLSPGHQGRE